jgi:hypothetical protein
MMKKILAAACLTTLVVASAGIANAGSAPASGIYQSPHDIRYAVPGITDVQDRLCAFCHTPHHALDATGGPLWSHAVSTQNPAAYSSPSFDTKGIPINDAYLGDTRLCMSCHDGTVAVDSYYGNTGSNYLSNGTNTVFTNMPMLGTNMSQNHPVGFDLLAVIAASPSGAGGSPNLNSNLSASSTYLGNSNTSVTVGSRLFAGQYMTCRTCHDVHNQKNSTQNSIKPGTPHFFILGGQLNSGLCITCHNQAGNNAVGVPVTY